MIDGRECLITIVRDDGLGEDNPTFVIDQDRWRVPSDGLEGFGGVEYDVSTQAYAQYDGSYLLDERVPERDRSITADAWFDPAEARAEAMAFFIPRRRYTVHCTYMGVTRYFAGRQYAFEVSTGNVWRRPTLKWTCLALEPMWLSEDEKRFDLAKASGRRGFPFVSFAEGHAVVPTHADAEADVAAAEPEHIRGFVVGIISARVEMTNDGHAIAYPRFDVSASDAVVNPAIKILDASGSVVGQVGLSLTLNAGDELVIDFAARPTSITLDGKNVSHLVTRGSTLATGVPVGTFYVEWSAASGDAALSVRPSIHERYTGI